MSRRFFVLIFTLVCVVSFANAQQRAEVSLQVGEPFFTAMLDSVYQSFDPPAFRLSGESGCGTLKIIREAGGTRTAVQFRGGQIRVPLAFSGNYAPPFIGCVEFSGWADSVLELEFDQVRQKLIGRARVTNVHLDGAGGLPSAGIARLLQSSIDKRLNPIEILKLDKLSFGVPIPSTGTLRMRAVGLRHEVSNGALNLRITYEFTTG